MMAASWLKMKFVTEELLSVFFENNAKWEMIEYESHCHGGLLRELVDYSYQIGFSSWEKKKLECGKLSVVKRNKSVKTE